MVGAQPTRNKSAGSINTGLVPFSLRPEKEQRGEQRPHEDPCKKRLATTRKALKTTKNCFLNSQYFEGHTQKKILMSKYKHIKQAAKITPCLKDSQQLVVRP